MLYSNEIGMEAENSFQSKISEFGKKAAAAFAVAAAAAVAYGTKLAIDGVKAAIEDEQAQLRLANALRQATGATDAQIKATEDMILKTSLATGVADDKLRPAMQRLAVSTKSTEEAQKLLTLALDISAASGKDLETVANALGRAYNSLTKEGSSAIYDITGVKYDEGQGFVYEDEFGEKRFRYPIAGSFIGGLVGRNIDSAQSLQLTAPVQSLNLAFGSVNPGVPGIGPVGQFAFQASGKSAAFGPVWDTMRNLVMPFGEITDPVGSLAPAWLRKTFYYLLNDQKTVERGVKDWASYLASTGQYGENPLMDDTTRNQLFKDAEGMSRGIGLLTALFQSIAPATPSQEIFAKIPNNKKVDFASMTMLYNAWDQISRKHPGDYFAAPIPVVKAPEEIPARPDEPVRLQAAHLEYLSTHCLLTVIVIVNVQVQDRTESITPCVSDCR